MCASSSVNSPFFSRASGASTISRVSSGRASTASTIWLTVCAASGRPWSGQNGVPVRAYSRRREAWISVTVPTVERGVGLRGFCSMAMAGDRGGEAFEIGRLAFGVQGVESQAGFARAGQAGDHHQLVARNVQVNVLEVVRARPPDADLLLAQRVPEVGA